MFTYCSFGCHSELYSRPICPNRLDQKVGTTFVYNMHYKAYTNGPHKIYVMSWIVRFNRNILSLN